MNHNKDFFSKDYFFGRKNSNYHDYNKWDNDLYWSSIVENIKKYQKNKDKILDIGCAFGFLLKRLQSCFNELHGVDISSFAIQKAREELSSANFAKIDINNQELPYPDEFFDVITALDILEHTFSIEESLNKIVKKISPDGIIIISVPIYDSWAGKIFRFFDKDDSHISIPSCNELFLIFDRLGLQIVNQSYFLNAVFFKLRGIPVDLEVVLKRKSG